MDKTGEPGGARWSCSSVAGEPRARFCGDFPENGYSGSLGCKNRGKRPLIQGARVQPFPT